MALPVDPGALLPMPARASYRIKFATASYDRFNGDYRSVMDQYALAIQPNNPPTPAVLQNFACNARSGGQVIPTAFLLMHEGQIHCYHSLSKFHNRLGLAASPWDDHMFVTKGELFANTPVTTYWLPEYFHQLPAQQLVATAATLTTAFAADPALESTGPYANGDQGTELVRVRRAMFLPPKYVPMMLDPVTPRQAWERLHVQIEADQKVQECAPLLQWLSLALTVPLVGDPSVLGIAAPLAPVADHILLEHRRSILVQDFPELNLNGAAVQQNQIATEVGKLTSTMQQEVLDAARRRLDDKTKSPTSLLGDSGLALLLRFAQVGNAQQLGHFWTSLAEAPKSQKLSILQWAIDEAKEEMGMVDLVFLATPALLTKVKSLAFAMPDLNEIKSGIQPFALGESDAAAASITIEMWSTINADHALPSVGDLNSMLQSKASIPRILLHTRESIKRVEILLFILLGPTHAMVQSLNRFITDFISRESMLVRYIPKTAGCRYLLPVLISKWVANRLSTWFKNQSRNPAAVEVPKFSALFELMELDEPWEPTLSPSLIAATTRLITTGTSPTPGGPNLPSPAPASGPTGGPAATPPDLPEPEPAPTGRTSERINNTDYKESIFGAYRTLAVTCRAIRDRARENSIELPKSKVDPANPMCLAFHSKGMCNARCRCVYDHVAYTESELEELKTWCAQHYTV